MVLARLLLLVPLIALLTHVNAGEVKVCLPSSKVQQCNSVMSKYQSNGVTFSCMAPDNSDSDIVAEIRCLRMIQQGDADMTVVGDVELYWANKRYGLIAYVAEDKRQDRTVNSAEELVDYYSVAVVRKDSYFCGTGPNSGFSALKGAKSCHTGYRKNAGWDLPVGHMIKTSLMEAREDPNNRVNGDAYSVAEFFNSVCAPGTTPDGPVNTASGNGQNYDRLCDLCKGDCSESDPYAGYEGALQCMMDRQGDVAFVKHTTPLEQIPDEEKDQYRLLCFGETAGCQTLDNYDADGCSLGARPPNALVSKEGWDTTDDGKAVINMFDDDSTNILSDTQGILWSEGNDINGLTKLIQPENFKRFMTSFENYDQIYQLGDAGISSSPNGSPPPSGSGSPSGSPSPSPSSSSSGVKNGVVDGGGAAGIAIGCFFGGVFVLALIMWVVNRNKKSKWDNSYNNQQDQLGAAPVFKETSNPMAAGAPAPAASPPANDASRGAMRV